MNKKELVKLYIDATASMRLKENVLSDALQNIDEENQVFNMIPNEYRSMVDTLLLEIITPFQLDWVGWWMYEDARGVSDATGCTDLENFDEFYAFTFDNVPVNEIVEARNGSEV